MGLVDLASGSARICMPALGIRGSPDEMLARSHAPKGWLTLVLKNAKNTVKRAVQWLWKCNPKVRGQRSARG